MINPVTLELEKLDIITVSVALDGDEHIPFVPLLSLIDLMKSRGFELESDKVTYRGHILPKFRGVNGPMGGGFYNGKYCYCYEGIETYAAMCQ